MISRSVIVGNGVPLMLMTISPRLNWIWSVWAGFPFALASSIAARSVHLFGEPVEVKEEELVKTIQECMGLLPAKTE